MSIRSRVPAAALLFLLMFLLVTESATSQPASADRAGNSTKPHDVMTQGPASSAFVEDVAPIGKSGRPAAEQLAVPARATTRATTTAGVITNVPVATLPSQQTGPSVTEDAGGTFVVWQDERSGAGDIYAQKLSSVGVPLWLGNGVPVCKAAGVQILPRLVSDGAGGVIIVWQDKRSDDGDIYAQRVSALGSPLWAANGIAVCTSVNTQKQPVVVSDGVGGVLVAWIDDRFSSNDVWMQRVNGAGVPQWAECGIRVCAAPGTQQGVTIVTDGQRGAIAAWQDGRTDGGNIFAQRLDEFGVQAWLDNGVAVCATTGIQDSPVAVADGLGGEIVAWSDGRGANRDIYAQRLDATGTVQWTANGQVLCAQTGDQRLPVACADGAGGAIVAWQDGRPAALGLDVYAQRVDPAGAVQWTSNGVGVCTATADQTVPSVTADPVGGAVVGWSDARNVASGKDVYVQHLSLAGAGEWTPNGVQLCDADNAQERPLLVADGLGGATAVWEDLRAGTNHDIYSQRVDPDGQVNVQCPVPVNLPHDQPEITAVSQNYRTFNQIDFYWSAVGVRGSSGDWDLEVYDTGSALLTPYPVCFGRLLAGSYGSTVTDFVMEDSNDNATPPGVYGARAFRYSGTGNAVMEWDGGVGELFANSPGVGSSVPDWTGLLDTYDVGLNAGVTYWFHLTHSNPAAATKVLIFSSYGHIISGEFKYVVPRSARVAESVGEWAVYTPPAPDYYGVVVVNDNGLPDNYTLQALSTVAGVGDGPPLLTTRLKGISPNPSAGRVQFDFVLHEPGAVAFEVVDMAGRVVAHIAGQRWEAGTWSVGWDGRRGQGTEAPPGIYFVQMRVDGRPVGTSRLALIR